MHSYGGGTTNFRVEELLDGQAWIAFEFDGDELAPEHGGPLDLGGTASLRVPVAD